MKKLITAILFCSLNGWANPPALIPAPAETEIHEGRASVPAVLTYSECPREASGAVAFLNRIGEKIPVSARKGTPASLHLKTDAGMGPEAYTLTVTDGEVSVTAGGTAGFVYAFSALIQAAGQPEEIPAFTVRDRPETEWRGFMLDSARHFQSIDTVIGLLDKLAFARINRLHWHLTDNDGWRIESRKFPKLNTVSSRVGRYPESERNGFYTFEEIARVSDRAAELGITVYPEIDMPGHAAALVEAYPELLCPSNRDRVPVSEKISNRDWTDILCVANPDLFPFLTEILDEVLTAFRHPEYFHMGGDEVPLGIWAACPLCSEKMNRENLSEKDLLTHFLKQYASYLEEKGVTPIYWCEYPTQKISDNAIAQVWRAYVGRTYLKQSLKAGIRTLNAAGDYAYFDYPQFKGTAKSAWMPVLSLKKVYTYNFRPSATAPGKDLFMGGACTLWTEEVNQDSIDEMIFPRLFAFSEQMWTPKNKKNFARFGKRLEILSPVIEKTGISQGKAPSREALQKAVPATVATSLNFKNSNYPEYAVNGRDADAFVSAFAPKAGDYFSVRLKEPAVGNRLQIISGGFFIYDTPNGRIDDGTTVSVSYEGREKSPVVIGSFRDGIADCLIEAPVREVRIDFRNEDQPVSVNEIIVK